MEDLSVFCCQNPRCVAFGARNAGNLTVCGRIGKHKQIRHLYCRTCKKRFSERKGTIYYRTRHRQEKTDSILRHIAEGCGVRQTARLEGVKDATVIRRVRSAGRHAQLAHPQLVAFSPDDP